MDFRAWQAQVVAYLDELLGRKLEGKSSRLALLKGLELPESFFGGLRRLARTEKGRISFDKVFRVINRLEEHPIEVLYEAGRQVDRSLPPLPKEESRFEALPREHCVRYFGALLETPEQPGGFQAGQLEALRGYHAWCLLKKLAQSKPLEAIEHGAGALKLADIALQPRILAVLGTALRRTDDLEGAFAALEIAEHHARLLGDTWAVADTWQRRAYVLMAAGEPEQALELARAATGQYNAIGCLGDAGRATVDQGICLAADERFDDSILAFRSALKLLPPWEHDNRFGAMVNIARASSEQGDLDMALQWAKRSTAMATQRISRLTILGSWETCGLLAFRLGRIEEAEEAFRRCVEGYGQCQAHLDAALSLVWLCRCLLVQGRAKECREIALTATRFIGLLSHYRLAAGAIASLSAEANAGRQITNRLLAQTAKKLEEIRGRRPLEAPP